MAITNPLPFQAPSAANPYEAGYDTTKMQMDYQDVGSKIAYSQQLIQAEAAKTAKQMQAIQAAKQKNQMDLETHALDTKIKQLDIEKKVASGQMDKNIADIWLAAHKQNSKQQETIYKGQEAQIEQEQQNQKQKIQQIIQMSQALQGLSTKFAQQALSSGAPASGVIPQQPQQIPPVGQRFLQMQQGGVQSSFKQSPVTTQQTGVSQNQELDASKMSLPEYQEAVYKQMHPELRHNPVTGEIEEDPIYKIRMEARARNEEKLKATPGADSLVSIGLTPDEINQYSPAELQTRVQELSPAYYRKLEMLKEGRLPTTGRMNKELLNDYATAELLFPGEVDATLPRKRMSMADNIAKGDIFKSQQRGNTLIGHMDTLFTEMKKLNNLQIRLGNKAKNTVEWQLGKKNIQNAKQAALNVANEMEGYLRNSNVVSELGIQDQLRNIPVDGSPEQQEGWLSTTVDLFNSRRNAINDAVKTVMGDKYDFDVITPTSKKILAKHGYDLDNMTKVQTGELESPEGKSAAASYISQALGR